MEHAATRALYVIILVGVGLAYLVIGLVFLVVGILEQGRIACEWIANRPWRDWWVNLLPRSRNGR